MPWSGLCPVHVPYQHCPFIVMKLYCACMHAYQFLFRLQGGIQYNVTPHLSPALPLLRFSITFPFSVIGWSTYSLQIPGKNAPLPWIHICISILEVIVSENIVPCSLPMTFVSASSLSHIQWQFHVHSLSVWCAMTPRYQSGIYCSNIISILARLHCPSYHITRQYYQYFSILVF